MNKALIGEEVTLDAAVGSDMQRLIVDAVEAFVVAAGGTPRDLERFASELQAAVDLLPDERVQTRIVMVAAGVEVRLRAESVSQAGRAILCPA